MTNKLIPATFFLLTFLFPCCAAEPLYAGKPLEFWLDGLKSDDPLIREESILVLTDVGPAAQAAAPRLEALLKDEHAACAPAPLSPCGGSQENRNLLSLELTAGARDPALDNRAELLGKLSEMGSEAGSSAIVVLPYLQDANSQVRTQAVQAMQRFVRGSGSFHSDRLRRERFARSSICP